jgi:hypothetical protein
MMLKLLGNLSLTSSQFIPEAISLRSYGCIWVVLEGKNTLKQTTTQATVNMY